MPSVCMRCSTMNVRECLPSLLAKNKVCVLLRDLVEPHPRRHARALSGPTRYICGVSFSSYFCSRGFRNQLLLVLSRLAKSFST